MNRPSFCPRLSPYFLHRTQRTHHSHDSWTTVIRHTTKTKAANERGPRSDSLSIPSLLLRAGITAVITVVIIAHRPKPKPKKTERKQRGKQKREAAPTQKFKAYFRSWTPSLLTSFNCLHDCTSNSIMPVSLMFDIFKYYFILFFLFFFILFY